MIYKMLTRKDGKPHQAVEIEDRTLGLAYLKTILEDPETKQVKPDFIKENVTIGIYFSLDGRLYPIYGFLDAEFLARDIVVNRALEYDWHKANGLQDRYPTEEIYSVEKKEIVTVFRL